jgi:hypothetical protein
LKNSSTSAGFASYHFPRLTARTKIHGSTAASHMDNLQPIFIIPPQRVSQRGKTYTSRKGSSAAP